MALFSPPVVFFPVPADNPPAQVQHVAYHDVQWGRPRFRPPSLPTQAQIWSEVPFTARFHARELQRKWPTGK